MKLYKSKMVDYEKFLILNSATVQVGDAVKIVAGAVDAADAGTDLVYGIVKGIVTKKGIPLASALTTEYTGTWTGSTLVYAAAADNQTVDQVHALVYPVGQNETLTTLLSAVPGVTTGSNKPGYFLGVLTSDSTKLDETSAHATTQQAYITVDNGQGTNSCLDPIAGGNNVLVKVVETGVPRAYDL